MNSTKTNNDKIEPNIIVCVDGKKYYYNEYIWEMSKQ